MTSARRYAKHAVRLQDLEIPSPKRSRKLLSSWEGFFPYYAGYPETFAHAILSSARLPAGATVLDPWNGSGTTTHTASCLGLAARGLDLNPVMVVVARARLLPQSEANHLKPLASAVVSHTSDVILPIRDDDPLLAWFEPATAAEVRALERSVGRTLLAESAAAQGGAKLDQISGTTATFYVALFSACRHLVQPFTSSNPTWLRRPRANEQKISVDRLEVGRLFKAAVAAMADALAALDAKTELPLDRLQPEISVADTASFLLKPHSVDFVLTSPPYCTRIDYTAATRIELAVLSPLLSLETRELAKKMIGSTHVPVHEIEPADDWGPTCLQFLDRVRSHPSKASAGYYYKTHIDYFSKLSASVTNLARGLKPFGSAVLVVQDSHYKEIHNDLPSIVSELAERNGFALMRRQNFYLKRSMSGIHPHLRSYRQAAGAVETVLCFYKT